VPKTADSLATVVNCISIINFLCYYEHNLCVGRDVLNIAQLKLHVQSVRINQASVCASCRGRGLSHFILQSCCLLWVFVILAK
jgi:hypothetical protein